MATLTYGDLKAIVMSFMTERCKNIGNNTNLDASLKAGWSRTVGKSSGTPYAKCVISTGDTWGNVVTSNSPAKSHRRSTGERTPCLYAASQPLQALLCGPLWSHPQLLFAVSFLREGFAWASRVSLQLFPCIFRP